MNINSSFNISVSSIVTLDYHPKYCIYVLCFAARLKFYGIYNELLGILIRMLYIFSKVSIAEVRQFRIVLMCGKRSLAPIRFYQRNDLKSVVFLFPDFPAISKPIKIQFLNKNVSVRSENQTAGSSYFVA